MAAELWQAKKRSTKWVLNHLSVKDLKAMRENIRQVDFLAKNSGLWDFQRSGFFQKLAEFEYALNKAIDAGVYDKAVMKNLEKRRKKKVR